MKYRDKLAQMTDEELHQEMIKIGRLANWGVLTAAICAICAVITLAAAVVVAILS